MPGPTQDAEEKPIPHPDPEAPDPVELLSSVLEILAANSVYSWVWVIPENRVLLSHPSLASLFAVDPEEAAAGLPIETFFEAIHEEDRERVTEAFENAVASGEECSADYRVLGVDGRLRWVAMRGRAEYDGEGAPLRFPDVLIDITERKQAEERLALQNAVTRLLVEPRPLEDVIPEVLRSMGQGLQGSFGAYWRVDEAAGELRCEWVWRDSERLAEDLRARQSRHPLRARCRVAGARLADGRAGVGRRPALRQKLPAYAGRGRRRSRKRSDLPGLRGDRGVWSHGVLQPPHTDAGSRAPADRGRARGSRRPVRRASADGGWKAA